MVSVAGKNADADILLVGAGMMSATLGSLLHELAPELRILALERLDGVALESTDAMNNAGTGHAAYCELNYTPETADGSIDIAKAVSVNEQYETTLQYWSYCVAAGRLPAPKEFIHAAPHLSFVWGERDVQFLRRRHEALREHPYFAAMEYTEDHARMRDWMPLVMTERDPSQVLAATRVHRGTDVDFGAVTRFLFEDLARRADFRLLLRHEAIDVARDRDGLWRVRARDLAHGSPAEFRSPFVFLGAGGGALPLLLRARIPEGRGYGGFPVSGQWLVCKNPTVIAVHDCKVYGRAAVGAPPMSVPHLDSRIVGGEKSVLFGPFAGFSTKFLKMGSYLDWPRSWKPSNLVPMVAACTSNLGLAGYLVGQVLQSPDDRLATLRNFLPNATKEDWALAIAGQRVQIIKPDPRRRGKLEFGTEVVASADGSIAALLGASPGASTCVATMLQLIERCFADVVTGADARRKLAEMIPSYGQSLAADAVLYERVRARTQEALGIPI